MEIFPDKQKTWDWNNDTHTQKTTQLKNSEGENKSVKKEHTRCYCSSEWVRLFPFIHCHFSCISFSLSFSRFFPVHNFFSRFFVCLLSSVRRTLILSSRRAVYLCSWQVHSLKSTEMRQNPMDNVLCILQHMCHTNNNNNDSNCIELQSIEISCCTWSWELSSNCNVTQKWSREG